MPVTAFGACACMLLACACISSAGHCADGVGLLSPGVSMHGAAAKSREGAYR